MTEQSAITVRGISVRFGGVQALSDVNVEVAAKTIHAVIGPNGAGKTTLLNVCSGIQRPNHGRIVVGGRDVTGARASEVARAGLARTFQNLQLFRDASVFDNVMVGAEAQFGLGILRAVIASRRAKAITAAARARAAECIELVGLSPRAQDLAGALPYGNQRLLEIARALATSPSVLLLDEPGAGFNPSEKEQLADIIGAIRNSGVAVVLVEHDMTLVMSVADRITVLNFGTKIAEGTSAEVSSDPAVIDAYLGEDDDEDELVSAGGE
jgi:ABC-type branched-chain amino acid transport systems, ATPase component